MTRMRTRFLALALAASGACSFTGGDFTPMPKPPDTPCQREANEICKGKLESADFATCVAREKYRCEVMEQEGGQKPEDDSK